MYPSHTLYRPPRPKRGYFLPFLSLIILGLIVVLVFQIVDYFQEQHLKKLENKAAVTVLNGKAEMKVWGVDEWTTAASGSILHEGDMIRTAPGSRIILTLLNNSVVRLASETEVEIDALKTRDGQDEVDLLLRGGEIWLQRADADIVHASFAVHTPHLRIFSLGTIFDVAMDAGTESVRVLDGKVRAEVLVEDQTQEGSATRTAETIEVALGQEISISAAELTALRNRRPIDLLALLSDSFRNSEWYTWNRSEDAQKALTVSVADAVEGSNLTPPPPLPPAIEEPSPIQLPTQIAAPVVLTPKEGERTTKTSRVVITGETEPATQKLEVTTFREGKADVYALQKYVAGSRSWVYVAASVYGSLTSGENRLEFRAVGSDGTKSEPAIIIIKYDVPKEPAQLGAPKVATINGKALPVGGKFETEEESVLITGSIGKGIVKVVINDFALTRFVPGSTDWSYYAKTVYGNLKDGENTYTIYGEDAEGNKTEKLTLVVVKKARTAVQPPAPQQTPPPPPAAAPPSDNAPL